jgi:cyclic-di-GMP-binding biofilm dispersal mediator protein
VPDLTDRSVIVTGASGGLGALVARRLAERGARLTLVARSADRLAALRLPGAEILALDLRKAAAAEQVAARAVAAHGGIDGVVWLAGQVAFGPAVETPDQVLVDLFTLNALGPIRLVRAAAPHLVASAEAGREPFVLHVSGAVVDQPTAGMAGYGASKAALAAYDAVAARELRRRGVRLVDARPPHTETGLVSRAVTGEPPRLPAGLDPQAVADRLVRALVDGDRDLPAAAFA